MFFILVASPQKLTRKGGYTLSTKVIEFIEIPQSMMASQAIRRIQELVELHGDLILDGFDGAEFWPADGEGGAFLYLVG